MFSWQIGSRSQVTGRVVGKLSWCYLPLFISAPTVLGLPWTNRKQWLNPCLSFPDYNWHLSPNRGNCVQIVPNLSGHLLHEIEQTDEKRISLILPKIILFWIALNFVFIYYTLCQLPSETQFIHFTLNILPSLFTEALNRWKTCVTFLFSMIGSRLWDLSHFKESIIA